MYIADLSQKNLLSKFKPCELFCESEQRCKILGIDIFEPWNTFTCFAYIISAIIIALTTTAPDSVSKSLKNLYVVSVIILGIGTGLWHGWHILAFKIIDQIGMLLTIYTLLLCQITHRFDLTKSIEYLTIIIPVLIISVYFLKYKIVKYANVIFTLCILLTIVFMIYAGSDGSLSFDVNLLIGLIVLIIGKIVWIIDKKKIISLHHFWHILTGLSIFCFWQSFSYNYDETKFSK